MCVLLKCRDYRMPHNEVDEIDYMAEEGDILDFVMDDEEINGGGDQIVDDYDMVS